MAQALAEPVQNANSPNAQPQLLPQIPADKVLREMDVKLADAAESFVKMFQINQ